MPGPAEIPKSPEQDSNCGDGRRSTELRSAQGNIAADLGSTSKKVHSSRNAHRRRKVDSDWFVSWLGEFNKLLQDKEWASAKSVFGSLRDLGCDAEWVVHLLATCTHPDADTGNPLSVEIKTHSRNLFRCLNRLQMLASKTEQVLQALEAEPYAEYFIPLNTRVFRVELPVVLTTVNDYLRNRRLGIPSLQGEFDGRKIPTGFALIALCAYVQRITGRAAYSQIALLLDAGHAAHKQKREVDPESLRKKIQRFRKAHPEIFDILSELHQHRTLIDHQNN